MSFCSNIIRVKMILTPVANHTVQSLIRITSDVATERSKSCLTRNRTATPPLTPMPPGKRDNRPYPREAR